MSSASMDASLPQDLPSLIELVRQKHLASISGPIRKSKPERAAVIGAQRNQDNLDSELSVLVEDSEDDEALGKNENDRPWTSFWRPGFDYGAEEIRTAGKTLISPPTHPNLATEPHFAWILSDNACSISINNPKPTIGIRDAPPAQFLRAVLLQGDAASSLRLPYSDAFTHYLPRSAEVEMRSMVRDIALMEEEESAKSAEAERFALVVQPDASSANKAKEGSRWQAVDVGEETEDESVDEAKLDKEFTISPVPPPARSRVRVTTRIQSQRHAERTPETASAPTNGVSHRQTHEEGVTRTPISGTSRRRASERHAEPPRPTPPPALAESESVAASSIAPSHGTSTSVNQTAGMEPAPEAAPTSSAKLSSAGDTTDDEESHMAPEVPAARRARTPNPKKRARSTSVISEDADVSITSEDEESTNFVAPASKHTRKRRSILWPAEQTQLLLSLVIPGSGRQQWPEICQELNIRFNTNKTPAQCSKHYHRLNPRQQRTKWSFAEDNTLLDLYTAGLTVDEISKKLGRSAENVRNRLGMKHNIIPSNTRQGPTSSSTSAAHADRYEDIDGDAEDDATDEEEEEEERERRSITAHPRRVSIPAAQSPDPSNPSGAGGSIGAASSPSKLQRRLLVRMGSGVVSSSAPSESTTPAPLPPVDGSSSSITPLPPATASTEQQGISSSSGTLQESSSNMISSSGPTMRSDGEAMDAIGPLDVSTSSAPDVPDKRGDTSPPRKKRAAMKITLVRKSTPAPGLNSSTEEISSSLLQAEPTPVPVAVPSSKSKSGKKRRKTKPSYDSGSDSYGSDYAERRYKSAPVSGPASSRKRRTRNVAPDMDVSDEEGPSYASTAPHDAPYQPRSANMNGRGNSYEEYQSNGDETDE